MLIVPKDLGELFELSGAQFQNFVTALVIEDAISCRLKLTDIDADYRTNHPDGGCDIFVAKGQNHSAISLIPAAPSIWSIKAGVNGIDPAKLRSELMQPSHQRLRQHLKKGHVYVWCALEPAGQTDRKAMRDKAVRVALHLGIDSELIRFVWNEHLCLALNRFPNLIARYLPKVHSVIRPMVTLSMWRDESPDKRGFNVPFVSVPGSEELQVRIRAHLLGKTGDAVLHLAGLSGIGKTRTTIESCTTSAELSDTLYIGAFSKIDQDLWRRLAESHLRLIIDEVPLEEVTHLQDRFAGRGDQIRIISIGPAPRGQARRQRDPMLQQLEPPDERTGVLAVVEAAAPDLAGDVQRGIAHFAGQDLISSAPGGGDEKEWRIQRSASPRL